MVGITATPGVVVSWSNIQLHPPIFTRRGALIHAHMSLSQVEPPLHIAFYCNLMGWPKRSSGGVRQWVLTMANALVDDGHRVDVLSEVSARRFVDEPLLDARVGRVVLGRQGPLSAVRLRRFARANPGVRIVAALNHYNLGAAKLKRRIGDRVHVTLTQRENLSADAAWR
ncbi:MAG: hypothetical protein L0H29_05545, partial [Sinobacteraceae bacterium]|nr:hypothetical protein [Nevskiaceae bacterium]